MLINLHDIEDGTLASYKVGTTYFPSFQLILLLLLALSLSLSHSPTLPLSEIQKKLVYI